MTEPTLSDPDQSTSLVVVQAGATQFDGPFFRYLEGQKTLHLCVYYTDSSLALRPYDPELSRHPEWDNDAVSGYPVKVHPKGLFSRFRRNIEIVRSRPGLIILGGFRSLDNLTILVCAFLSRVPTGLRSDNCFLDRSCSWRRNLRSLALRTLLRLFSTGHPVGTLAAEYLVAHGMDPGKIFPFPYLVDRELLTGLYDKALANRCALRAELGIGADDFVILGVMKFIEREDPLTLLNSFITLWDEIEGAPDAQPRRRIWLVLVGDGRLRSEIESRIRERGVSSVRLPGYVSYSRLPAFFAVADVLVHPARAESWGVTVNEALVCGLPVVAAQSVGAARDLIRNGVEGFTFPPGEFRSLAAILRALWADPALVQTLKTRCRSSETLVPFSYPFVWDDLRKAIAAASA